MAIALTDWLLLGVLAGSMALGFWRGLVYEVLSLAGWMAAFMAAQWFAEDALVFLPFVQGAPESVQHAVAFVLVFVATLFASGMLSWLIKKLVDTVGLRPVDRSLGALFGLARGVVVLLAVTVLLQLLGMASEPWWKEAHGPAWLDTAIKGLKPMLPEKFGAFLP
jgi:membrane protein required for colicin V production